MSSEGSNKEWFCTSDIPDIDNIPSSHSYKFSIGGEAGANKVRIGIRIVGYYTSCHNHPRISVLDCDNISSTQNEAGTIQGEYSMRTLICRFNLMTIDIPLLDNTTRHRYEMLGVCRREANRVHSFLLSYDTMALPCLNIP